MGILFFYTTYPATYPLLSRHNLPICNKALKDCAACFKKICTFQSWLVWKIISIQVGFLQQKNGLYPLLSHERGSKSCRCEYCEYKCWQINKGNVVWSRNIKVSTARTFLDEAGLSLILLNLLCQHHAQKAVGSNSRVTNAAFQSPSICLCRSCRLWFCLFLVSTCGLCSVLRGDGYLTVKLATHAIV